MTESPVRVADSRAPAPASERRGPQLFDPPSERRSGSPGDVIRLLLGVALFLLGLLLATVATGTIGGAEADIVGGFTTLPSDAQQTVVGLAQVLAVFVPVIVFGILAWERRWPELLQLWLVPILAGFAFTATQTILDTTPTSARSRSVEEGWLADPSFPTSEYVAAAAAFVTIATPWLSRRWKRAAWAALGLLVLLRVVSVSEPAIDLVVAVAVGMILGSVSLLVFGSPTREPDANEMLVALREAGFEPQVIARAGQRDLAPTYRLESWDGSLSFVKARTPDDYTADLLNRLYRAVWLRSSELRAPYSSPKRVVEHEALVLTQAARAGARVPELEAIAVTEGGTGLLVSTAVSGVQLDQRDPDTFDDALVTDIWTQIDHLHAGRIAHRSMSLEHVLVDDANRVWIVDFDAAELAAPTSVRARDVTDMLVELSLVVGARRAVTSAVAVLGAERVAATLPLLQPLALPGATRRRMAQKRSVLDELRTAVREETGAAEIQLEQLSRFSSRTIIMVLALSLAFYALLPQFANLDDTVDSFGQIQWGWVPAILLASAASYVAATVSFLGSVTSPVPFMAAFRVGVASSFTALVGPANSGSMALSVRFLQRTGLATGEASAAVTLNLFGGVVTHIVLLFAFFAWAGQTDIGGFSLPDANMVLLIVTGVVVVVGIAMISRAVRRRVLGPVLRGVKDALSHTAHVVGSPVRVSALLGGSAAISLTYIAALAFAVEAFGGDLTLPQVGAAFMGAVTIATIAPTPGGLGAMEAALIAALTGFGLSDGRAVSAALVFRLATFWLPILPGWYTFNWMTRKEEL